MKNEATGEASQNHIPMDIAREILDRLPLKSLARFKCVSKLWSSSISLVISQRLREEWHRKLSRFREIRRSLPFNELKQLRLEAKLDEMVSVLRFDDDDVSRCINCSPGLRDSVTGLRDELAGCNDKLLTDIDALIEDWDV
ncbi:uncharacterized protein A4U43_C07F16600 [Asparagus officinalis]|uniref:F-box domain-containing protein n=1 Tax=Asparagus officinalis TaxID=4686 RepID=A0A5P1ECH4_ASPOF|nr:uncharacterized protein A4U43_C07F16600 [Asparagus officinalis]